MMFAIGLGGTLGAITRFYVGKWIMERSKSAFPVGTWMINISGSFVLGFLATLHLNQFISEWIWFFMGIGFLGAYTTFSTFGFETIQLLEQRNGKKALVYVVSSMVLGIVFGWFGILVGSWYI